MKRIATLITTSAFAALIAIPAFAADAPKAPAAAANQQVVRLGYVDMSKAALQSVEGKADRAKLKTLSEKFQAKLDAKKNQLEKQKKAIEAKLPTLSLKERQEKSKEFQKKVEEYQKLAMDSDKQMQSQEEKFTADLYKKIQVAATSYGKTHGFALVIAKKQILFTGDQTFSKDVTDDIITLMDKQVASK